MDAPLCKACGKHHWSRQPCKATRAKVPKTDDGFQAAAEAMVRPVLEKLVKLLDTTTYEYRDVEKRRAYKRDYMKRRRALKRLERETARKEAGDG